MSDTDKVISHMFINLVKIKVSDRICKQAADVVDGVIEKIFKDMPHISREEKRKIRVALCGMLAHGWALGMNPFNNPQVDIDGKPLEVRVSKDILIPMEALKALRYVKKDKLGRVEKAFFEPSAEAKIKEQIERILDEVARKKRAK